VSGAATDAGAGPEICLHLGAHRTGSTVFQRILAKNAAALAEAGIAFWGPEELRPRGYSWLPGRQGFALTTETGFALDLAELTAHRLILADENMLGSMHHNLRRGEFYPAVSWRLPAYHHLWGSAPVRIGLAVRGYAQYWASVYAYQAAAHELPDWPALKAALLAQPRTWRDVVADIRAAFPAAEILVWPQEGFAGHELAVVSRFAGLPQEGLKPVRRRLNEGPGAPPLFTAGETATLAERYAADLAAFAQGASGAELLLAPAEGRA
jgi:hypothetical protein